MSSQSDYNTWPRRHAGVPSTGAREPSESTGLMSSNEHITKVKAQVNEVKAIMKDNIEKVIERGDKVTDLTDRAGGHILCMT